MINLQVDRHTCMICTGSVQAFKIFLPWQAMADPLWLLFCDTTESRQLKHTQGLTFASAPL